MWRHYLTVGLRSLAADRVYALVSIGGLAAGFAGCLMILAYVRYEHGYDRWLPGADRVFQVQTVLREPGQPLVRSQASPFPVRDLLASAFPAIEAITVVRTGPAPVIRGNEPVFIDSTTVDPAFFDIFRLPFAQGSAATALRDAGSVVLTEGEARRQFGTSRVLGRTLAIGAGAGRRDYRVGGVLRDLPADSNLRLALVFRHDPADTAGWPAAERGWGAMSQWHYVRLRSPADADAINAALPAWKTRVGGDEAAATDLHLAPVRAIHLGPAQQAAIVPGGDPETLATFLVVAALTLAMAVMNFANLAAARALGREREMAVRRVLGANRGHLARQMLVEALLATGLATLLAAAIVELATPWVAARTGATLSAHYLGDGGMLPWVLGLWLLAALTGSLLPLVQIGRIRPGAAMRATGGVAETAGGGRLRAALVVGQFAVAIGLIACTVVIERQTRFLAALDPGYRREGLIQIDAAWRFAGDEKEYRAASRALLALPGLVSAGRTNLALAATNRSNVSVRTAGATSDLTIGSYAVDPGFFVTMDVPLLAGRLPGDVHAGDRIVRDDDGAAVARAVNVVVNRTAARTLGFADPADAVGRRMTMALGDAGDVPATIVGVVADTRIRTPRDPLEPILYLYDPSRTMQVLVRYAGADPAAVMAGIHRVWRRFEPEIPFQARFAEDILAESGAAEQARGTLFAGFAGEGIIIACLGLYALSAFVTRRRMREIGIRKVFGARVRDIVRVLAWQFSKPVMIANLVAWPVAWAAMRDWLSGFDARIPLGPAPFLMAGLIALVVAVATVSGHAVHAARRNPVLALQSE